MIDFGRVPPGSTLYIPFHSFAGATGASITLTGLATTDIEVYKNGSATQRASDTGYTLLDTDGIDFDGTTGIHGFSIDLSSNADAGFYVAGGRYFVVLASVTIDSQTVNLLVAQFEIGYPNAILNTTIATLTNQTSFTLTAGPAEDSALVGLPVIIHDVASAVQLGHAIISAYTGSTKTVTLSAGTTFTVTAGDNISFFPPALLPTIAGRALLVGTAGQADGNVTQFGGTNLTATGGRPEVNVSHWRGSQPAALVDTDKISASVQHMADAILTAAKIATDAFTAAKFASDVTTEFQAGLATAAALATVATYIDTEVAEILAKIRGFILFNGTIGATGNDTTHVHLPSFTYGNDEINDMMLVIFDVSESEFHARWIEGWDNATKLATVAVLPFTPQASTDGYHLIASRQDVTGGSGLDAAGVRDALGMASANMDSQLAGILSAIQTKLVLYSGLSGVNSDDVTVELEDLDLPNDTLVDYLIEVTDVSDGNRKHATWIDTYNGAGNAAGLTYGTFPFTVAENDPYVIYALKRSWSAEQVRSLVWTAELTNYDVGATLAATVLLQVLTEALAIKAKTDSLPSDPADQSLIDAAFAAATVLLNSINSKTTNLPPDPADASDIAASFTTVLTNLATIAGYIDTEVAAIKAKTDNLPSDPADASDIATAFGTVNSTLATIAAYIDTEVAAIKAKTDNLPSDPADESSIQASLTVLAVAIAAVNSAVSGLRPKKNTAVAKFPFKLVNTSDKTAHTGGTVTASRMIDGAAFALCANAVVEVSNGWYTIDLDASDLNGNTIGLLFTSPGADQRDILILTQP